MDIGNWTAGDIVAVLSLIVAVGSLLKAHRACEKVKLLETHFTAYVHANYQPLMFSGSKRRTIGRRISDANGPTDSQTTWAN